MTIEQLIAHLTVMVAFVKNRDILKVLKGPISLGVIIETIGYQPSSLARAFEVFDLYQRGRYQKDVTMVWALNEIIVHLRGQLDARDAQDIDVGIKLLRKVGKTLPDRYIAASSAPIVSIRETHESETRDELLRAIRIVAPAVGDKARVGEKSPTKSLATRFRNLLAKTRPAEEDRPRSLPLHAWQRVNRPIAIAERIARASKAA